MKTLMILSTVPDERLEMVLKEAKEVGYRTVFCGEHPCTSEQVPADVIYEADWTDLSQLVDIAKKEHIDGVLGLTDSAVIPASMIAEALELPGNPVASVEQFLSKSKFRALQKRAGVFCPQNAIVNDPQEMAQICSSYNYPIIVKPMLASSSHGMTVLESDENMEQAFAEASAESRNGAVCVEEFIQNDSLRVIEADIFVVSDDIIWDGIRYCYRLECAPLRPVYDVYPVEMTPQEEAEYKGSITAVLREAGVRLGDFDVEGFFTPEGRFFIIEINPRQAGHYTPQDVQLYCGINLTKLLITTATRDMQYYNELKTFRRERNYILGHSVFSEQEGILDHIYIDPSLKAKMRSYRYLHGQKEGDYVRNIRDAIRPIVVMIFVFDTAAEVEQAREHITELVYPVLK